MILAPLRGVTIRCFRESFAEALDEYGFTEAVTPFITANAGVDPLKDRELRGVSPSESALKITPQFIGKDPADHTNYGLSLTLENKEGLSRSPNSSSKSLTSKLGHRGQGGGAVVQGVGDCPRCSRHWCSLEWW